ncbi:MAG: bioC 2 [Acidimicrobiales bacterium]|nr:bioC 2 [Acidimicrobiales bacterium]
MDAVLSPIDVRVLGSLLEKELTVPATYPLTLKALVSACNQTSGRDPILDLSETEAMAAVERLKAAGLARMVHASHGARSIKFRQVVDEALELAGPERAVLTLLLLRGPQTPGELRSRAERLHRFRSLDEVEVALVALGRREPALVRQLPRQPGHKEARWLHLLSGDAPPPAATAVGALPTERAPSAPLAPVATAEVAALGAFVGRWVGAGAGEFPTIEGFAYTEEIELRPVPGKPLLAYSSATRAVDDGRALHGERGFVRLLADGSVELVVAHGFGVVEVAEGFVEDTELVLASTCVAGTSSAKEVTAVERRYRVDGDALTYELAMAAVGEPLTHHLRARLTRQG